MDILLKELQQNEAVLSIQKKESVLGNLSYMEEALLLAADYRQKPQKLLIIKNNAYTAQKLYERLQALLGDEVLLFSLEESLRVEAIAASPENKAIQMEAMAKLQQQDAFVAVLNTAAAIRFLPSPEVFKNHCITLKQDQEIEYEDLKQLLFEAGYTHVSRVDQPLCYAARGGIIDVYSMNYDHPLRIEFFDNIVESIRFFDIATQRTIEIVQEAMIIPASDLLFTDAQVAELVEQANKALKNQLSQHDTAMQKLLQEHVNEDLDLISNHMMESRFYKYYAFLKNRSTVFEYAPDAQIILSSTEEVQDSVKHMHEEMVSYLQELFQEGISLHSFDVFTDLYSSIKQHSYMEFHQFVDYKKPITSQIMTMSLGDINLERTMPEVEIGVAHGQMTREDIEDVMLQFTDNKYQVLVCTTIIETGIDIPNANTILIEDADHFGLSQLYQIKGRVGRSDRLAYAYLMYSPQKQLSEIAMKRLKSIKEFTQLGSGYKIAMRDLTIRGAGDMLGPQQAGFIDTVGIDMYIEMLNSAIMEKKGIKPEVKPEMTKANVKVDAYIPSSFATEDYEKITLYQRMEDIHTKKELLAMMDEIKDNYGKLPKAVQLLFEKKRLDICINEPHVDAFRELPKAVELTFTSAWSNSIDGVALFEMMTTISKNITIRYMNGKITMKLPKLKDWLYTVIEVLERTEPMGEEQTAS